MGVIQGKPRRPGQVKGNGEVEHEPTCSWMGLSCAALQLGGHEPEQMLCRVINVPEIIRPCSARPRPGKPGPEDPGFASGWLSIWPELDCTCLLLEKDISHFSNRSSAPAFYLRRTFPTSAIGAPKLPKAPAAMPDRTWHSSTPTKVFIHLTS